MPLIDLRTDLKSLKYGQDRPGGGNSGQPYVQYPLPEVASQQYLDYYNGNKYNLDFPIRGGGPGLGDTGPYITQAARFDKIRIQKFLKDAPRGPIFILKQTSLQLANPKIQVGGQINPDLGVVPFRLFGNLETTRIYNGGLNTLAQVGVQGSGTHFDRHGTVPVNPPQQKYIYIADDKNNPLTEGGIPRGNRLYTLYLTKIQETDRIRLDSQDVNITTLNTLGISRNPNLLFQYPGGPSSVGGIGLTTIHKRYSSVISTIRLATQPPPGAPRTTAYSGATISLPGRDVQGPYGSSLTIPPRTFTIPTLPPNVTAVSSELPTMTPSLLYTMMFENNPEDTLKNTGVNTNTQVYSYTVNPSTAYAYKGGGGTVVINRATNTDLKQPPEASFAYGFTYNQLSKYTTQKELNSGIGEDFRIGVRSLVPSASNNLAYTQGYSGFNNLQNRYGVGSPGSTQFKRVEYNQSVDRNGSLTDITQDEINMLDVGQTGDKLDDRGYLRDLITFRFDTIEINKDSVPIVFRAFLTALTDNHTADYSGFKYVGRGENFYTYNGFSREVGFNFKAAVQSRAEMKFMYRKLNYLISQLYPDYKPGTGFMRAPLLKLTIGDYIYNQPGFLKAVNITVPDDAPWEIANNQISGADDDIYQLPHLVDVSCQFTPLHDFLPRRGRGAGDNALIPPFITPNTPGKNVFGIAKLT